MLHYGYGTISVLNHTHAFWETVFHKSGQHDQVQDTDKSLIENSFFASSSIVSEDDE
jgi:hypothetical protein